MNNRVYLVPPDTELPEILGLDKIQEENRFLKIAKCSEVADGSTVLEVTDGDLDFYTTYRLDLPFEPVLLTNIPGVKYSRHFLLTQSFFDSVSYDILEVDKVGARQKASDDEKVMNEKLQTMSRPARTFRPPRAAADSAPSDNSADVVFEED